MTASRFCSIALVFAVVGVTPVAAQTPGSTSAIHTVSVTVPPRVKVQVTPLASPTAATPGSSHAPGLSVTVIATQGWVVAIAKRANTKPRVTEWSRHKVRGFTGLAEAGSVVARGAFASVPVQATVFLRDLTDAGEEASPIVLTVTTQ